MPEWLILADDLTGANDSGVAFARRGLETICAAWPGPLPPADVWVISSASRALAPAQAAGSVCAALEQALAGLPRAQRPRLYKKIDSALRGSPGEELAAALLTAGLDRALVAPALPSQGRITQGGRVYWRGLPLAQTEFGGQICSDDLFELFEPAGGAAPLRRLGLEHVQAGAAVCAAALREHPTGIWIADALSETDLDTLIEAAQAGGIQALCGSAGLAGALARALPAAEGSGGANAAAQLWPGPAILAAGSRSRVAAVQVEAALAAGARHLELPFHSGAGEDLAWLESLLARESALGSTALVFSLHSLPDDPARAGEYIARLAGAAAEAARRLRPAGMVLTGGETAAALFAALHARLLRLEGETEPGIARGRLVDGDLPGLAVVTKAGSFGTPRSLANALDFLR